MKRFSSLSKSFLSIIINYYFIRTISALIPLIIIPYAARILDHPNFSLLMYTLALGTWTSMLISYGNTLSGIRNIACNYNQLEKITPIVSETLTAQIYLIIFSLIILSFFNYIHIIHQKLTLLFLAWIYGIAQGFNPLWIFQGLQKLKPLSYLEFFSHITILLLIFFILPIYPKYSVVISIIVLGRLLINFFAYKILLSYHIQIYWGNWQSALYRLKHGFGLFFLVASVSLYTTLSTVILGFFSSFAMIGMFASMEKLVRGLTTLILSTSNAVIPYRYILRDQKNSVNLLNKYTLWISVTIAIFLATLLYIFAQTAVNYFLGPSYQSAVIILKILTWIIPCYVFSTILSSQYLIPAHKDYLCNIIYSSGGIICIILASLVVPKYGAIGMSAVVLTSELLVLILMLLANKISLSIR
ncbi:MAG: hypothetical protein COY58_02190 [Gammaproteobacteria bacterium CG_4_10_14_0_8_um_filter_38_16]|nr:MAG: hypothetical protein COY58_02190 [Gammaproteobacteria bacterium CG_4_10_14_0_8_um_filter_38_16]PJA04123.1 MAG: hypothetical protein COX72_01975 [Gammaproteobacteria bacterium CG_4_10_14_0_2_um_filter_38_22]PJB10011.1 MAG: hypothetical protein CO120_06930 [Gammaproteobacteria bacterium CG_4_9_14_3_um_filter_38_9]